MVVFKAVIIPLNRVIFLRFSIQNFYVIFFFLYIFFKQIEEGENYKGIFPSFDSDRKTREKLGMLSEISIRSSSLIVIHLMCSVISTSEIFYDSLIL
jgi:hypothetical protein